MKTLLQNNITLTGFILYLFSATIFGITLQNDAISLLDTSFESFFINYGIFIIYLITVFISNKKQFGGFWKFSELSHNIFLLLLANISAFALNREIAVFQASTNWLAIFFSCLNIGLVWFAINKDYEAKPLNYILVTLFTSGVILGFYGVLYVLPVAGPSILVCWFFGFPLHTFVPLFWMLLLGKIVLKFLKVNDLFRYSAIVGITFPLVFIITFTAKWNNINYQIKAIYRTENVPLQDREVPRWVELGQILDDHPITKKILKSKDVYTVASTNGNWLSFGGGRFNERKKHDPFVVIASFFSEPVRLEREERIKLLNAIFNERHKTERTLWSGEGLNTERMLTNIQLFPEYRMAYTEKTIDIHAKAVRWGQREAFYTFHLPEGSVVSSASLWVEGEERPSFLTTRNKADSAYTTIVGRERRDPLLIHWQEGNRVTVRVFPVTKNNPRTFKIGVTSPLKFDGKNLTYENPSFEGPYFRNAKEEINIIVSGELEELQSSLSFEQKGDYWTSKGGYKPDWFLKFKAPKLSAKHFSFNGKSYQLTPNRINVESQNVEIVYLDINSDWSRKEFDEIWSNVKEKEVFVYQNKMLKLTEKNRKRLFKELNNRNFSLFPFHKMNNTKEVIVLTKNEGLTPVLDDLDKTKFSESMNEFMLENNSGIIVLDFGENISPYLKTLKEVRAINVISEELPSILNMIKEGEFPLKMESKQFVLIDYAGINILESESQSIEKSAPDHLLRLFAYNDLMRKIGKNYFSKSKMEDELVSQAEEAHVVTPVSSLLVLETQEDYDRFDIKESENSLKNASFKDSGSVPEPHEWMLIILGVLTGMFLVMKQYRIV